MSDDLHIQTYIVRSRFRISRWRRFRAWIAYRRKPANVRRLMDECHRQVTEDMTRLMLYGDKRQ